MRLKGIIKVITTLVLSFLIMAVVVGVENASVSITLIALYAWLGEYIALWRVGAIPEDKLDAYEKSKLQRIKETVGQRIKNKYGEDISNIHLYIVPSVDANGMAYGFNNVSITRGALESCDELTLCGILSHEASHILCLDSVFNRIIFGDITAVILCLMVVSFASVAAIWLVFFILALCGICRSFLSIFITSTLSKGVKAFFEVIQRCSLVIYQIAISAVSRQFEYRADQLAVDLGFGVQLSYFLSRFADHQDGRIRSLSEILYASHPATHLRIEKIKQKQIGNSK